MITSFHEPTDENGDEIKSVKVLTTKISSLESMIRMLNGKSDLNIQYFLPSDACLLKCTQMNSIVRQIDSCSQGNTLEEEKQVQGYAQEDCIFGISRFFQQHVCIDNSHDDFNYQDTQVLVTFETYGPPTNTTNCDSQVSEMVVAENLHHVKFVDATHMNIPKTLEEIYCMLRTILVCSKCCRTNDQRHAPNGSLRNYNICQCVSPWSLQEDREMGNSNSCGETSVCLLIPYETTHDDDHDSHSGEDDDDGDCDSQEAQLAQMCTFRVGDAAPSFYLHCAAPIALVTSDSVNEQLLQYISNNRRQQEQHHSRLSYPQYGTESNMCLALVYRQIPPRFHLQHAATLLSDFIPDQYHARPQDIIHENYVNDSALLDSNIEASNTSSIRTAPLWEAYMKPKHEREYNSFETPASPEVRVLYRQVAPPYISNWKSYYHHILQYFLEPQNFRALQEEARQIPQWSPWPEQQHYDTQSGYNWTVFPLCHTFPATDSTKRKWIQSTCAVCPRTVQMLLKDNGLKNTLRTALFSRLRPNTTLAPHTGWEDLANHVFRVHIPLIVPSVRCGDNGMVSCCGTWVDGCVKLHEEGVIQVFDDSKVHRAFNYSHSEERIVLIIDLARPKDLPLGTAVGGHTEELDAFINEML